MKKPVVAIYGVGMMGGSLGLALRKRKKARVLGLGRNPGRLKKAKAMGACDDVSTDLKDIKYADIVVICTTVNQIIPAFNKISPFLKPGAVVTDIGSVKSCILAGIGKKPECRKVFTGSHPMTGSEKTGVENADPGLYENAAVVICPFPSASPKSVNRVRDMWHWAGADTMVLDPSVHDKLVSQTSHLPHVLAAILVGLISNLQGKNPVVSKILAGSFTDMTRITGSDPRQWAEIISANGKFALLALKAYKKTIEAILRGAGKSGGNLRFWERFFSSARQRRARLLTGNKNFS